MRFFVPHAGSEEVESVYEGFARWCGVDVPPTDRRVASIAFTHDGAQWTATVGDHLRGSMTRRRRRKAGTVDVTTPLSDPAAVLAIFAGDPYLVVTNARPLTDLVSGWVNPFMAGRPTSARYFEPEGAADA
ncbi:MAG: hypothetical protein ACLGHT_00770 [Acidimicrobiia bacterium]